MVLAWMNETLKGSAILEKFKSKRVRHDWLQRFMDDYGFTTEDVRPLEECRKKWETSENVLQHYQLAAKVLVEAGLAVKNPDYKEGERLSEPIKITKPHMMFEFDVVVDFYCVCMMYVRWLLCVCFNIVCVHVYVSSTYVYMYYLS